MTPSHKPCTTLSKLSFLLLVIVVVLLCCEAQAQVQAPSNARVVGNAWYCNEGGRLAPQAVVEARRWTAIVTACGWICYEKRNVNLSTVFAGPRV